MGSYPWSVNGLDLYVQEDYAAVLLRYLTNQEGYGITLEYPIPHELHMEEHYIYKEIAHVTILHGSDTDQAVYVYSTHNNPVEAILSFHSSKLFVV